jgi:cytoskeletal protein CcmA (bactofilin family)
MKRIFILMMLLFTALNIFSIQVVTNGKNKDESKSFNEPYMFFGNRLNFNGSATDLFGFADSMNIKGDIGSDFIGFAKNITLSGNVGHNLLAGAGLINIEKNIDGTVFLAGKTVDIGKDSVIKGALFIGAGTANISGTVNGDVYVGASRFNLNGVINGNVKIYSGKINISDNGKIKGNVEYHTEYEMSKDQLSKIEGKVQFVKENFRHSGHDGKFFNEIKMKQVLTGLKVGFIIFTLLSFLIAGLLMLLFPGTKRLEEERSMKNFWFNSLFGLIPLFIYPTFLVFLFLFVVTIPVFFVLLLAILPILMVMQILGVTMLGQFLFKLFKWNSRNRFLFFLFGSVFFALFAFIPFLNFLMGLFTASLGSGFVLEMLFRKKLGD